mmetsp:Transcript_38002/g.68438  ORF Transcript_38002/g.68438 Transcript_38002/m.68438 type:complete len:358 (+) Transcript_38002:83-1156(+)
MNFINRQHAALLRGIHARSQGTVAIARHANEQTATKATPKPYLKATHFNSSIYPKTPITDFSSMALKRDDGDYYFEAHSEALFSALNSHLDLQQQEVIETTIAQPRISATARDMDLVEAAYAARDHESYDKILILMRHGEAKHNVFERKYVQKNGTAMGEANADGDYPVDPMLTGKGCGQMLDISRRTATFFNRDTGLQPDLVVVSPLRRAIQSALISFPYHTAQTSLSNTPWICHPMGMEQANGNKSEFVSSPQELGQMFPGVDFALFEESLVGGDVDELNGRDTVPLFESKIDLMGRTDEFLRWIKEREERVIVVSSHATWLQSLCAFPLQYEPESKGLEMFKKGEMRSVGLKFD